MGVLFCQEISDDGASSFVFWAHDTDTPDCHGGDGDTPYRMFTDYIANRITVEILEYLPYYEPHADNAKILSERKDFWLKALEG